MNLYLADSRLLRFFSFTIFYFAQGLPFGLVSFALPAFLAERGQSPAAIAGFLGVAQLPWSFKLLAGPLMDRFCYLAMGRRRPWVIWSQLAMTLTGFSFLFFPNGADDVVLLTALCFLVNVFSATQDVAVDGMAIDVLPVEEHGRANAFMGFGQVAGISASTVISAFALKSFGLTGVALMLTAGFGLILLWAVLVRERSGEKVLPWTEGAATARSLSLKAESWSQIVGGLWKVMVLPASLLLSAVSCLFRFADGVWITLVPIVVVQQLGYQSTDYSSWTSINSFVAAVGGLFLGIYIDKLGIKRFYLGGMISYGLLAIMIGLMASSWANAGFLVPVSIVQSFIYQTCFVCFIAIHMKLCDIKVAATQFALYMALVNVARSLGSFVFGALKPYLAYEQMFLFLGIVFLVGAALLWKVDLQKHQQRLAQPSE